MIKFNNLLQTQFTALSLKGALPFQIREAGQHTLGHACTQKDEAQKGSSVLSEQFVSLTSQTNCKTAIYTDSMERSKSLVIYSYLTSSLCCAQSLSYVQLFVIPWTVACQAPLSMGILQAGILEWVAMPSSRGSSQPRYQTQVSCIAGGFFTN